MIFWNTRLLAERLRNGEVTEKEKMIYFLLFLVSYTLLDYLYIGEKWEAELVVEFALVAISYIFGTLYLYWVNKKGDGKNFMERYIILGLPIEFRLLVFFTIIMIIFYITLEIIFGDEWLTKYEDATFIIFFIAFELFFYHQMTKWIRFVSKKKIEVN